MSSHTDLIKDKLNILDVVGAYVQLEKAGKTYKGKSPFTHEKTPSFFVSPEKGFFYCFSSGKGGDIFTFIEEIERVDFKEALKILADKAGIELDEQSLEGQSHHKKLLNVLDYATKWYEVQLRKNSSVVQYLIDRGLEKQTIAHWRLGFVREAWRDIYEYLVSRKYSDHDIEQVGLVIKKQDGGYYDRFRSRVMFPLMDGRGRVVGFSGRIFGETTDASGAKYINSPEGVLFDKSKVLYGYHQAKHAISKYDSCILVEGQFDVLLAHQSGFEHTVAISGTGLTNDHVAMIKRFTNNLLLALDSDNAGIKATRRSLIVAYQNGMDVKIVSLPQGKDPADIIKENKEKWAVAVADAKDYIDYRLGIASLHHMTFEEKKKLIDNDIFEFVFLVQSAMVQDRILQKIALFLGVSIESVRQDFNQFKPKEKIETLAPKTTTNQDQHSITVQEQIILDFLYLKEDQATLDNETEQTIHKRYQECYESSLEDGIQNISQIARDIHVFVLGQQRELQSSNTLVKKIFHMFDSEELKKYKEESRSLVEQIRIAESNKDFETTSILTQENQKVLKKIQLLEDQQKHL